MAEPFFVSKKLFAAIGWIQMSNSVAAKHCETVGKIIRGMLKYPLLAYAGTRKGASVAKAISGNMLSYLDRLSVPVVLGGIIGLRVNTSFWHSTVTLMILILVVGF